MTVDEEQLRGTLHRQAESVEPSHHGWTAITRRIEQRQRRTRTATLSLVGGFSLAAVAVAATLVTHAIPETNDQRVAATGGSAPAYRPTTTVASSFITPTTVSPFDTAPGQVDPGAPDTDVGPFGPTTIAPGAGTGAGPDSSGTTTSGFQTGTIYPETAAELETIQAQLAEGHQPWWVDPGMVASSYLGNRGLTTGDDGAPESIGEAGALRYTADGGGGWVSVGQLVGGSIYYVQESRSDRIVSLRLVRQGDRLGVDVLAATGGKVVVRTKRPGSDWNPSATQTVVAGKLASLTVDGAAGADLIVQVRHVGDDGTVGLAEERLDGSQPRLEYDGLHDGSVLGPSGLGPVTLGMTLAEAQRAAGTATTLDRGESCTSLAPVGHPAGVAFVSTAGDDRVDVITVGGPGVRTDTGIGVGSTVAEVRKAYPGIDERLTLDGDGRLVHAPDDPALGGFEIVFGMVDGRVASIWSGAHGLSDQEEICA